MGRYGERAPMPRRGILAQMRGRLDRQVHRMLAYLAVCRWLFTFVLAGRATGSVVLGLAAGALLDGSCIAIVALRPTGILTRFVVGGAQAAWPVVWALLVPGFAGASLYGFVVVTAL